MSERKVNIAEVFDYSAYRLQEKITTAKRNPKTTQAEIYTLQAVLQLYLEKKIHISWLDGEPYMSLHEDSGLDNDALKQEFESIVNGAV